MFDFKNLIDVLKRRGQDEAPPTIGATRLIANLPRNESLHALIEIVRALAELNRNPKASLKERAQTVLYFDDRAQPLTRLLVSVYRGQELIEGVAPRQVLPTLLACWQEMAAAYKVCLKQHAQAPSRQFAAQAELVTLRAMEYYAIQAKWSYLRHFEVETKVWRNLHRLYQVAESAGFADKPIFCYPQDPGPITVRARYMHALLLRLAEPERRRPEQIWQLDDWLVRWQSLVRLEKVIRPRDQLFAVNLDEPKPPMKLRRNMVGERYRYFATENLANHLEGLAQTAALGDFQAELGAIPPVLHGMTTQLLSDLSYLWSREGQSRARRHERSQSNRSVPVIQSLNGIAKLYIQPSQLDLDAPNPQLGSEFEEWLLDDESNGGIGANYKARYDDNLAVGEVVAIKPEGGQHPTVGVVRRMCRAREGRVKVGIEKLGQQPVMVALEHQNRRCLALYLAETSRSEGQRALLLDNIEFHLGHEYLLHAGGKRYRIRLGPVVEYLPNYTLSAFSVLEKQG